MSLKQFTDYQCNEQLISPFLSPNHNAERVIKTINIDTKQFTWSTTVNFTHFNSKWVERSEATLKTLAKYVGLQDPFGATYGYLSDGIYNPDNMVAPSKILMAMMLMEI